MDNWKIENRQCFEQHVSQAFSTVVRQVGEGCALCKTKLGL